MKRGNLRTSKDYKIGKWRIQGKKKGRWVDAWDEERIKLGLPKDLIFDLEYDACGYLQGFIDWAMEDKKVSRVASMLPAGDANGENVKTIDKIKANRKKKQKLAKQSKRRNRK